MTVLPSSPKTLIVVDGRKGGVGKSTVAAAVYEYLRQQDSSATRLYDLDGQHGDLSLRYSAATQPLRARRLDDYGQIIDDLMDPTGLISTAVVDVGAPAGPLIDRFLIEAGPLQALESGQLSVIVLWVVGATPRSMQHLSDARDTWQEAGLEIDPSAPASARITVIIVANEGQGSNFGFIKQSASASGLPVIVFPRLEEEAAQEVVALNTGFLDYTCLPLDSQPKPSYSRQMIVRRWLATTRRAFDDVPQLSCLTQPHQTVEPERSQDRRLEPTMTAAVRAPASVDAPPVPQHPTHLPPTPAVAATMERHAATAVASNDVALEPAPVLENRTGLGALAQTRSTGTAEADQLPPAHLVPSAAPATPASPASAPATGANSAQVSPPVPAYPGVPAIPAQQARNSAPAEASSLSSFSKGWPQQWPQTVTAAN